MTFLAYAFIIIASIVAPNLFPPAGAAIGDGTYPEEVHQLVLQKLNKLHGRTDPDHLGQWGAWSTWTPCSRSCGTGVSTQSRECLPPRKRQKRKLHKGENGEFDCIGRFTRYQLCNRQMCPRGLTDFRAEQCASYNRSPFNNRFYKWEPFIDGIDSCTLNCRAVGMSFYATLNQSVIDGTPCGQRAHRTRDRYCVHGNCMIVGCDGLLGSGRKADACGICGGDNSTCRMISGVYGRPSLPFGYNLIATLPPGATNLSIYHVKPSTNYLALRELGGNYILNGPWGMNSSGSFEASGTVFTYSRPHAHGGDHLYARGPTTHSVDIMLFYQNTNPGIKYEYRLPLTSSVRSPGSKDRLNRVTELTKPDNHYYNKIAPGIQVLNANHAFTPYSNRLNTPFNRINDQFSSFHGNIKSHNRVLASFPQYLSDDPTRHNKPPYRGAFPPLASQRNLYSNAFPNHPSNLNASLAASQAATSPRGLRKPFPQKNFPANALQSQIWTQPKTRPFPPTLHSYQRFDSTALTKTNLIRPPFSLKSDPRLSPKDPSINSVLPVPKKGKLKPRKNLLPTYLPSNQLKGNALETADLTPYNSRPNFVFPNKGRTNGKGVLGRGTDKNTSPLYFESGKASWSRRPDSAQGKTQYSISSNKAPKRKPRDRYVWVSKGFTECSRSCGGGTMSTRFICMKKKKVGSEVPPYFCSNVAQPKETVITCNSNPCPPQWEATSWSDCSVTCGLGVQVRKLICKQATSSGTTIALSEDECGKASTLRTAQVCQMRDCDGPPSWEAGLWSDCSSQCGLGTRRRKVTCSSVSGPVSEELCKEAKPQTEEICDMGSCASDTWFFSEWDSICRGSCGQGLQKRRVHCSGDSLQGQRPSTSCPSAVKPDEVRSCASKARCGSVWFTGPWGDCDARCGVGRQRRAVVCLTWHKGRYKVAKSDATCSSEEEKPQDVRSCVLECHAEWFTSDWSKCSAPCDGGVQRREVKCLDHNLQPSIECHSHAKPDSRQSCNTKSCNERNTGKEVRVENEVLDPRRPIFSGSPNVSNKYNPPGKRYEYLERGETSYVRGDNYGSQSKSQDPDGESSSGKGNVHNTNNHRSFPETSETGETLTNETPFPAHTNVEAPETSQTLRNVFDSGKRLNSQSSSNLGRNYDSLDSEGSQPSSPEGSTVEESSVNKRGDVKKEPTPGQPLKSGLCMDRMKNCHLVYKARLCKLKYYNKLCCDTCTN